MLLVSSYIGFILLSVQLTKCDISDIIHGEDEPDDITVEPRLDGQHNSNGISLNDALPGTAGIDYPIFSSPPRTHFTCQNRHFGYYADIEAKCQVFRVCANTDITGSGFAFLCPNGTLFNQQFFVCDWYSNVYCPGSEKYFVLNEEFGKRVTPDKLLANAKAMAVLPKLFESTQTFVSSIMHAPRNLTGIGFSEDSSSSLETSVGTSTRKPPTIQLQVETGGTFTETKEQIRKPIYSGSGIIGSYIDRQKIPRIKQTFSGDASGVETNSEGVGVEVEDSTADPLQKESIRPIITNQIEQIPGYTYDLPPSYQTYSLGTSQSFDAINQYYPVASPKNQYLPSLPSQEYLPTQKYLPTIPTQKYLPSLPSQQYLPSVPSNKYLPTPVDARTSGKYYSPSASSVQDSGVQYAIRNEYIPPKGQLPLLKPKINAAENYFNRNDDSNEDTNSDDGSFYGNFGKQVYTYPLNETKFQFNGPTDDTELSETKELIDVTKYNTTILDILRINNLFEDVNESINYNNDDTFFQPKQNQTYIFLVKNLKDHTDNIPLLSQPDNVSASLRDRTFIDKSIHLLYQGLQMTLFKRHYLDTIVEPQLLQEHNDYQATFNDNRGQSNNLHRSEIPKDEKFQSMTSVNYSSTVESQDNPILKNITDTMSDKILDAKNSSTIFTTLSDFYEMMRKNSKLENLLLKLITKYDQMKNSSRVKLLDSIKESTTVIPTTTVTIFTEQNFIVDKNLGYKSKILNNLSSKNNPSNDIIMSKNPGISSNGYNGIDQNSKISGFINNNGVTSSDPKTKTTNQNEQDKRNISNPIDIDVNNKDYLTRLLNVSALLEQETTDNSDELTTTQKLNRNFKRNSISQRYPSSNEPIAYYPQEQQQYVNNNNYQTSYGSDDISYKNRYPVAGQYASSIPSILPSVVHSSSATGRQNYNSLHDNVIVKVVPSLNWYLNDANERRSYFNAVSRGLLNENGYFYVNNVRGNNQRQHYNTSPYNKNFISNLYSDNNGFSSYRGPFSGVENYSYRK